MRRTARRGVRYGAQPRGALMLPTIEPVVGGPARLVQAPSRQARKGVLQDQLQCKASTGCSVKGFVEPAMVAEPPRAAALLEQLRQLGLALADGRLKRQAYRFAMLALLREHLACTRVSLWRFEGHGEQLRLVCRGSVAEPGQADLQGEVLSQAEFRTYFAELAREGVYACEDTFQSPVLAALRDSYLRPQDVRSLMDVSFTVNGRLYGVLCCEQVGLTRQWTRAEIATLLRFGRLVSLHVARAVPDELSQVALTREGLDGVGPRR